MSSLTSRQAAIQAGDLSSMAMMNMAVNGFSLISAEKGATATALTSTGTALGTYVLDQQIMVLQGSMGVSAAQVAAPFPSCPGIAYGTKLTITTAQAVLGASDYLEWVSPIEASRLTRLGWGSMLGVPLTLGIMVRPSVPLVAYLGIDNGAVATRKFLRRTVCPANQDTFVPLRFDPEPTGVWNKDNSLGAYVRLNLGAGSARQGGADTWQTNTNLMAAADATNLAATAGNSVIVSGLVMFPGIVPISKETLPLIARHLPDEERLCRRYFEIDSFNVLGNAYTGGGFVSQTGKFDVAKIMTPAISVRTQSTSANATGVSITALSPSVYRIYAQSSAAVGYLEYAGTYKADARM